MAFGTVVPCWRFGGRVSTGRMFARNKEDLILPVKTLLLTEITQENIKQLIHIENFSNYHRLYKSWCMCSDLWDRGRQRRRDDQTDLRLTWTEEIDSSNILWLKVMQVSHLNHPKLKDWKREIETFTDEKGIIRKCQQYRMMQRNIQSC